jgi:uncharacterized membrane protein YedE/YeeE
VAVGAPGLTAVYATGAWPQLNQGLPFRPVNNIVGGLVFGIGMVVAASCASGLFYKLGAGMLGAAVGIAGWAAGELAGGAVRLPGDTVLAAGQGATLPGLLGVPRWAVAVPLSVLVVFMLLRTRREPADDLHWSWVASGIALGVALVASWVLAGVAGHPFGASTVGAVAGIADGRPPVWLIGFLVGIVAGSLVASVARGTLRVRGEDAGRYGQLVVGGFLLGAGARVAGGCNLGHGLSGAAQLNVSSFVMVAAMVAGVWLAASVRSRLVRPLPDWRPAVRT